MAPLPSFPAGGTLAEWARVFTDVELWRQAVSEICRRHALGSAPEISAGYPGSNAVFVVDHRWVVKIAWPFDRTGFHREVELLELLEPYRETLLTPRLVAQGTLDGDPGWPYCVMARVPGQRLGDVWPTLRPSERLDIAEQLGVWVRALHAVPMMPPFRSLDSTRAGWERFIAARGAACVGELAARGSLPAHLLAQFPGYLAAAQPLYPPDLTPVLLNGDVTEDHVFLSQNGARWEISGYIDFDDALTGHAEWELAPVHLAVFGCDATLMRAFLQSYGWDGWQGERFRRRMLAFCLLHPWFDFRPWIARLGGAEHVASLESLETALWGSCP